MHQIIPHLLWVGNAGDLLKPAALELAGVKAVIQVALAEQMPMLSREMLLAHFPIVDGAGNARGIIAGALETTASLIRFKVPTLVCCSGGMKPIAMHCCGSDCDHESRRSTRSPARHHSQPAP